MLRAAKIGVGIAASLALCGAAPDPRAAKPAPSVLEGTLRVHPKFHFKYYLDGFGDGQSCALFKADERLQKIAPGSLVRVRGQLACRQFGADSPPSALAATWIIYLDVREVEVLSGPVKAAPRSGSQPPGSN